MRRLPILVALCAAASCSSSGNSGGSSASLDCNWLGKDDNCYKTTVTAASACFPAMGEFGMLSQDNLTCAYPSGVTITFDQALVLPVPDQAIWNFTVTRQGQTCLRHEEPNDSSFRLTTSAGTFGESVTGSGVTMSCPDGTSFSNADGLSLLSCDGGFLGGLPGHAFSSGDMTVMFSLLGTSGGSTPIFDCRKP
jgi:hypothetical protein